MSLPASVNSTAHCHVVKTEIASLVLTTYLFLIALLLPPLDLFPTVEPQQQHAAQQANAPAAGTGGKKVDVADESQTRSKKNPDAPKRFKSAFMFFSIEKHKELREKLKDEEPWKKKVSQPWNGYVSCALKAADNRQMFPILP